MKRELKKVLALLLIATLMITCLAGCGNSGSGKNKNTGGEHNGADVEVEIAVWNSGTGIEWLDKMVKAFNSKQSDYYVYYSESVEDSALTAVLGMEDIDTVDLYMVKPKYDTTIMEPLDDIVLNQTAEGDQKPLIEKFNTGYLGLEQAADGHYYTLTYGGGVIGFYYNTELFEQANIKQLPRTSNEFIVVCDSLYSNGITPLCHFIGGGYYEYLLEAYMAQYDGFDYYMNNFYACTDENGNSPSKDVFTKKDGRYQTLKFAEKIITPEYTLAGSNTKSHTEVQTEFINGRAAMMLNGSWLQNEMKHVGNLDDFKEMRMPVISAIVDKLSTVKSDTHLRKLVSAIDQVTDGEKQLSDFTSGDGYVVEGMNVSKKDWEIVSAARNTIVANYSSHDTFIPSYSDAKDGAAEFMKFMYSDEGYKIFVDTLNYPWPMSLSTGETIDTSSFSEIEKSQFALVDTAEVIVDVSLMSKHRIFIDGGASKLAGVTFPDVFSSYDSKTRKTADGLWEKIEQRVEDSYESGWLKNIK